MTVTDGMFRKAPLAILTTPRDGEVYVDRWWMVDAYGDPVFFTPVRLSHAAPQCNSDRRMFEHVHMPTGCSPMFLSVVYLGHRDDEAGWTWLASQLVPLPTPNSEGTQP